MVGTMSDTHFLHGANVAYQQSVAEVVEHLTKALQFTETCFALSPDLDRVKFAGVESCVEEALKCLADTLEQVAHLRCGHSVEAEVLRSTLQSHTAGRFTDYRRAVQ